MYLWGSGDAYDTHVMGLRRVYGQSLSMKAAYAEAFRSAGLDLDIDAERVALYDIYSCFPVAVEQVTTFAANVCSPQNMYQSWLAVRCDAI